MYRRHIVVGMTSLLIGLFLTKYLNSLWFANVNAYLKEIAFTGFRDVFFNHFYIAVGLVVGIIIGNGLKIRIDLIILRLISGPLVIALIYFIFFGLKAVFMYTLAFLCAFTLSIFLSYLSSKEE